VQPIGANDPAGLKRQVSTNHRVAIDSCHRRTPKKIYPDRLCSHGEQTVQRCPFYAPAIARREPGSHAAAIVAELNPVKRTSLIRCDANSQSSKAFDGIGHETLAACLIDWGMASIENDRTEAEVRHFDCGCQPRGPSANDSDVIVGRHLGSIR
jgi:hypothetical protein